MFFTHTLLDNARPLARVWLAANQERQLNKTIILNINLNESISEIIKPSDAPFALRLSGQLLLGVARIYRRKATYLLDDCNEALVKIQMTFRSGGDHDLPSNVCLQAPRDAIAIPDRMTSTDSEMYNLPPMSSLDDDMLSTQLGRKGRANSREINLQEDFSSSQFLDDMGEDHGLGNIDEEEIKDLGLDFADDLSMMDKSLEMGRDAPTALPEDDLYSGLDMGLDGGLDVGKSSKNRAAREESLGLDLDYGIDVRIADNEGDTDMAIDDEFRLKVGEQSAAPIDVYVAPPGPDMSRARISESPLSDVDEEYVREMEGEYRRALNQGDMYEPDDADDDTTVMAPQRCKKRKLFQPDEQTMIPNNVIKEQQAQRNDILKPQSFLPRNLVLKGLVDLHKNGGLVSSIMFESCHDLWAPELRGLLSMEPMQRNGHKRKRDSGIADMGSETEQGGKSPRLELPQDESMALMSGALGDASEAASGTVLDMEADHNMTFHHEERTMQRDAASPSRAVDETSAGSVQAADSGPVSVGTQRAVHLLRNFFGTEAAMDDEKREKTLAVFQDVLPEGRASKVDATKMFFECLVLATKDAIKLEQPEGMLGGPIRVRGKRGLWGQWAECEVGGEMAQEQQRDGPAPMLATPAAVSVSA